MKGRYLVINCNFNLQIIYDAINISLSNLQQELLKFYSSVIDDADLLHIKTWLAKYFADKAIREADSIWQEKRYTDEIMDQWLNEDKTDYGNKGSN